MAVDSSNPIVRERWHDEAVQMNKVPVIGSSKGPWLAIFTFPGSLSDR